jgi:hypothetical protein
MNAGNAIYFRNLTKKILCTMLELNDEQATLQYLTTLTTECNPDYIILIEGVVKEVCPHLLSKWHKLMLVS